MEQLIIPLYFVDSFKFETYLRKSEFTYSKEIVKRQMSYVIKIQDPMDAFWIGANSVK